MYTNSHSRFRLDRKIRKCLDYSEVKVSRVYIRLKINSYYYCFVNAWMSMTSRLGQSFDSTTLFEQTVECHFADLIRLEFHHCGQMYRWCRSSFETVVASMTPRTIFWLFREAKSTVFWNHFLSQPQRGYGWTFASMAVLPDGVQRIELALQSISARRPDLECFLVSVKKDATEKLHKRFESAVRNLVRSVIFRWEKTRKPLILPKLSARACRRSALLQAWADDCPGPLPYEDRLQERQLRGGRFPESWHVARASRNGHPRRVGRR